MSKSNCIQKKTQKQNAKEIMVYDFFLFDKLNIRFIVEIIFTFSIFFFQSNNKNQKNSSTYLNIK